MRQILLKMLWVGLILILLFVLLNILPVFKNSGLSEFFLANGDTTAVFPLTIKNEQLMDLYHTDTGFAVLTKADLLFYNTNGSRASSVIHGYTNPVVKEGGRRLLTYDRGGVKLRVDTSAGSVGELTMENNIICAEIAQNGNVAVIMNYKNYAPVIVVYDANLKPIYRVSLMKDFTAAAFSSDGTRLAVCSIEAQEGILCGVIYEMNITKESDPISVTVSDIIPLAMSYQSNGDLLVLGMENLIALNVGGKGKLRYYEYPGELQQFALTQNDMAVLVNQALFGSSSVISTITSEGKLKNTQTVSETVTDLYADGSRILVLTPKALYHFDMNLSLAEDPVLLERSYSKVTCVGEIAFLMGADSVERLRIG